MGEQDEQRAVTFCFQLHPDQREALGKLAKERQLSVADVTREAVREYLAADVARRQEPAIAA